MIVIFWSESIQPSAIEILKNCTIIHGKVSDEIIDSLTVIALMSDSCPENVCLHIPSRMSHNYNTSKANHFCFYQTKHTVIK